MALQIKHADYAPNWNGKQLNLQAMGNDIYDYVWGGTSSFDFARADLVPNVIDNGYQFKNLRDGGAVATAVSVRQGNGTTPALNSINTDKGLPLYLSSGANITLPAAFELTSHGSTTSAVIHQWINKKEAQDTSIYTVGICNGAMNQGTALQWVFGQANGKFVFSIGSNGSSQSISSSEIQPVGEYLLSIFIQKTSSTNFTAHAYINNTKVGSVDRLYPLNAPNAPKIGGSGGSSGLSKAILRRCGVRIVDPAIYTVTEHEAWIAEQIAANSPRF
ncbi:hypothetical protein KTN00_03320 [Acinetobacter soli]|uniref:hypothetical protein n=1 Tax=Acinetobacter soli TaxID=487316 RepID=UPI001C49056B|nr:hypothetical protein [Acinetobacter soli]MBV6550060.1 hypothetical protein [Acinetobacter soli]